MEIIYKYWKNKSRSNLYPFNHNENFDDPLTHVHANNIEWFLEKH